MLNIRVREDGIVTTAEYPSIPQKINDTDVIIEIDNAELEQVILQNPGCVKILNIDILEYEIIQKILTKEEINKQVIAKIREVYDINKEFEMQRRGLQDPNDIEYQAYLQYVQECLDWGNAEKAKYGY